MNKITPKGYHALEYESNGGLNGFSGHDNTSNGGDIVQVPGTDEEDVEKEVDDVLNELDLGYFHYRLLLICGLSYMADAVEVGFLSYASLCIKDEWNLNTVETSSITATLFFGSLVGNVFVWQRVADAYGRRPACILGNFIVLIFGLSNIIAPNIYVLLIMQFFAGVGVGSVFVPFDLLAEYLPSKSRGNFLTNINYFWTTGSLFISFGAWCVITTGGWRALAVVAAAPVLFALALTVCFLPESPRWLVLQGKCDMAKSVVLQSAQVNECFLSPFYFASKRSVPSDSNDAASHVWSEILSSKVYRKITCKLMLLSLAWGLSYYAVVLLISRMYSDDDGGSDTGDADGTDNGLSFNYEDIFLNALCELIGIFITSRIIDRLGRKKSQALLYGFGALSHILTAWLYNYREGRKVLSAFSRICIIGACSVTVVLTPELYPTSLRVGGHALANSASRIGSILAPYLAQNLTLTVPTICLVLALVDISAVFLSCMLPETAGRTLENVTDVEEEIRNIVTLDYQNCNTNENGGADVTKA